MERKIYHSYSDLSSCAKFKGFEQQQDGSLLLKAKEGLFLSDTIWAEAKDTVWQYLNIEIKHMWKIELYIWISNDQKKLVALDQLSLDTQFQWLKENCVLYTDKTDCFLFNQGKIKGNFLKFALILHLPYEMKESTILYSYDVFFPLLSFVSYLPSCFNNDEKKMQFLNDYQCAYELLEEEIENYQYEMDVAYCDSNHLDYLAKWLDATEINFLNEEHKKRILLANYIALNSKKGTKQYYEELLAFMFGNEIEMRIDKKNDCMHFYAKMINHQQCQAIEQFFKDRIPLYMRIQFHWLPDAERGLSIGYDSSLK